MFFTQLSHTPLRIWTYTKHPKIPLFLPWTWKWANELQDVQSGPKLGKMFESCSTFLEVGFYSWNTVASCKVPRVYNCFSYCPCPRSVHVSKSAPVARLQLHHSGGSCMFMLTVETLSARDSHWQNSREIIETIRECSNIKAVSPVDWQAQRVLSEQRKMAEARGSAESFSTLRESNPCRPTYCESREPQSQKFILIYQKKK